MQTPTNPEKTVLAVSSVSAPTATAAASPTSAPTTAAVAAASATTAVASVPAASTSAAFALWTRLVDDERSPEKVLAVQSFNCFVCFRVVADLSKTEAARLPRKPIAKQRE